MMLDARMRDDGSDRLATYGSLRPGERHSDLTAALGLVGEGTVRGVLGDWEGYPILSLDPTAAAVPVAVFDGVDDAKWAELDAFEGPAYRRDLVDVRLEDGRDLQAQCYVRAADLPIR
jgi:gamma-glutamylcyclotransferase (GGCT)/AIG2-like uncharacterized protein YtfP